VTVTRREVLGTAPAAAYRGTFAPADPAPLEGASLPPGWEGLAFPFEVALDDLRPDGSPARDGVLPQIDLPRRMYAGEDTVFHRPLRFGDDVEQTARVGSIVEKTGRSGRLVFADLVREYRVAGVLAIESTWHDVFLEAGPTAASTPPAGPAAAPDWSERHTLDTRQLFRFSALTFNTHRVHYDRHWATDVEGLDDLLVHGPLTRILLLDAARRHGAGTVASYAFRSAAPWFVDREVVVEGRRHGSELEVVAIGDGGRMLARGLVTERVVTEA
jgi:3-methylfumaryl-CoA hydratase